MHKKILIIVTILNCAVLILNFAISKHSDPDISGYEQHLEELDERISVLDSMILIEHRDIAKIKNEVNEKDSIIDGSNIRELDSMFNDFFTRTGHHLFQPK